MNATARPRVMVYGARDETFWSGSPFYFASALRELGAAADVPFDVQNVGPRRVREVPLAFARWAIAHRSKRSAMFLLSPEYHACSFPARRVVPTDTVGLVSFSQVLPPALLAHKRAHPAFKLVQYIDVTLHDLMASFDWAKAPPASVREAFIRAERAAYALVDKVCVFHDGVAETLVKVYGVDASRISVEGRGVNLSPSQVAPRRAGVAARGNALRLAVVGKGPKRKGVFNLIAAIDALTDDERARVSLSVFGPEPHELPQRPWLQVPGFIPKEERDKLTDLMRACDLGVLLSEADSHPGSVWEFLSLGVPVWVSTLPHIEEELAGFPALFEPLPLDHDALVVRLRGVLQDPALLERLVAASTRSTRDLGWRRPAASVGRFLNLA